MMMMMMMKETVKKRSGTWRTGFVWQRTRKKGALE